MATTDTQCGSVSKSLLPRRPTGARHRRTKENIGGSSRSTTQGTMIKEVTLDCWCLRDLMLLSMSHTHLPIPRGRALCTEFDSD